MRSPGTTPWLLALLCPLLSSLPGNHRSGGRDARGGTPTGGGAGGIGEGSGGDGASAAAATTGGSPIGGTGESGGQMSGFASALRVVKVDVPPRVQTGDTVQLVCHYDLEGDNLYSLTWWRGGDQFYQYSPDSMSPVTIYNAPGVLVDEIQSGGNAVILRNVSHTSAGRYRCEILADHPSFEKDSKIGDMDVVAVPESAPIIAMRSSRFFPGELLTANCSSAGASSPPRLQWYINGEKISGRHVKLLGNRYGQHMLQLRLKLRSGHFTRKGRIALTCTASLHGLYHRSKEIVIVKPGTKTAAPVQKLYGDAVRFRACALWISLGLLWHLLVGGF